MAAILNPPLWILKIWRKIHNQRPRKPKNIHFYQYCRGFLFRRPSSWIRYYEFRTSDNGFVISAAEKPRICIFTNIIAIFSFWWLPSWIRHLKFWKSDNGFVISDPKNTRIPNFMKIRSLEKCMLQRVKVHLKQKQIDFFNILHRCYPLRRG